MSFGSQSIQILSLILVPEQGFAEAVMMRPFAAQLDYGAVHALGYTPTYTVGEIAGSIACGVRPNMYAGAAAQIPNGWGTTRYRYVMQVSSTNHMGVTSIVMCTGYSDYCDPSLMGSLDYHLPFRINEISEMAAPGFNPNAQAMVPQSTNLLTMFRTPENSGQGGVQYLQRPADIFASGPEATIFASSGGAFSSQGILHPLAGTASVDATLNASPVRYVYGLVNAAVQNSTSPAGLAVMDDDQYRARAITQLLRPANPLRNPFVAALGRAMQDTGGTNMGTWCITDLMAVDPSVFSKIKVMPQGNSMHYGTMGDTSATACVAAMYAQSVPAYMSAHGVQVLEFQQYYGDATIVNFSSVLQDRPMDGVLQALRTALMRELYPAASYGGQMPFNITVRCYLFGHTYITITDDVGRVMSYDYPTYASGTYSPMLTNRPEGYMEMASSVHELLSAVQDNAVAQALV